MMEKKKLQTSENQPRTIGAEERWRAFRRFLGTMWRAHPGLVVLRLVLITVSAVLQPLAVYAFALLIEAIGSGESERAPLLVGLTIGFYAGYRLTNDIAHSWLDSWYARAVSVKAQEEIFAHIARLSPEVLTLREVRRDIDFAREDMWRINNLSPHVESVLRSVIQILGAVSLGLLAPWWVLAMVLVISLLQAWNAQGEARRDVWNATWNSYDGRQIEYARYLFLMGEDFRELRLLGAARRVLENFRTAGGRILARFRSVGIKSAFAHGGLAIIQGLTYSAILITLAPPTFRDPSMLGVLYISLNLFSLLGDGLSQFAMGSGRIAADLTILARINHLLTFPEERTNGLAIPKVPIVIEFRYVSYRYPGGKKDALSRVTVTLKEGEHLAIVGENGAGKSTFVRLLAGLDRPTKGVILINGKKLDEYRPEEWRRAFHLMLQDSKLFQDYLGENLRYGEGKGRWKNVGFPLPKSLAISGGDAVVRDIKNGLGAFIGDWVAPPNVTPVKTSGGQTQRLVISRTLIHGGRFICFDEPTSAMDALAETAFFERLHETLAGRGIIYISHRFSTVRRATRILVFEEGRLIEDGPHEELIVKNGHYAALYNEQARWYS